MSVDHTENEILLVPGRKLVDQADFVVGTVLRQRVFHCVRGELGFPPLCNQLFELASIAALEMKFLDGWPSRRG